METRPPFIYDSLDRKNATDHKSGEKITYKSDYRSVAIYCFTLLIVAGFFLLLHWQAWNMIDSYDTRIQTIGYGIILFLYVSMIIALGAAIFLSALWGWNKARIAGLVNVLENQLTLDTLKRNNYAAAMLEAFHERQNKSIFEGISTLTLDMSKQSTNNPVDNKESIEEQIAELEDDIAPELFKDLQEKGLIGRSGNSILIGVANDEGE